MKQFYQNIISFQTPVELSFHSPYWLWNLRDKSYLNNHDAIHDYIIDVVRVLNEVHSSGFPEGTLHGKLSDHLYPIVEVSINISILMVHFGLKVSFASLDHPTDRQLVE